MYSSDHLPISFRSVHYRVTAAGLACVLVCSCCAKYGTHDDPRTDLSPHVLIPSWQTGLLQNMDRFPHVVTDPGTTWCVVHGLEKRTNSCGRRMQYREYIHRLPEPSKSRRKACSRDEATWERKSWRPTRSCESECFESNHGLELAHGMNMPGKAGLAQPCDGSTDP